MELHRRNSMSQMSTAQNTTLKSRKSTLGEGL
jgi:hypothetical protein